MARRKRFNPREVFSQQLPQIQQRAGASRAALSMGKAFERVSRIAGHWADRGTKITAARKGAAAAQQTEGGAPELQSPMTLAGESYNAAALDVYRGQLENRARADVDRVTRENEHDPAALDQRLDDVARGYLAEIPDDAPQLQAQFQQLFGRQKGAAMDRSHRLAAERLAGQRQAEVADQIEQRVQGMERIAQSAGVNTEARDTLIEEQKELEQLLLDHGPRGGFTWNGERFDPDETRSGLYNVDDIQQMLAGAEDRALESRVMGTFRQSEDPREFRNDFAADFLDEDTGEFKESPTTGLDRQRYEVLLGKMDTALRRQDAANAVDLQGLRRDVRDATNTLEAGFTPGEDRLKGLESRVRAAGDDGSALWEDLQRARDLYEWHHEIAPLTPTQLEGTIDGMRSAMNEAESVPTQAVNRLEHAESLLSNMRQGLDRDPLGWANRVGLLELDDVQFAAENPEDARDSMRHRRDQARTVASHYGVRPQYLTDNEADQLSQAFRSADVDQRLSLLTNLQQGFGDDTRGVLGQIADDVPVTAHIGGLLALDEDRGAPAHLGTARRALRGQEAMAAGNQVLPSNVDLQLEVDDVVGPALSHLPQTRSSLISTAEALYTEHALRRGISSEVPDPELWRRALHEAAGAVYQGGNRAGGGFGEFNGSQTILPPSISGDDELADVVDGLSAEDLAAASAGGAAPSYADGDTATPEDIASHGRLVPIDVGRYLVDMSEDGSALLQGSGPDGFYVLDMTQAQRRITRRRQRGQRRDGTDKGLGFFGRLQRPDGRVSTELSIGVEMDGTETQIPALVPTLSEQEISHLLGGGEATDAIVGKAVRHARERIRDGKSPFAQPGEQTAPPGGLNVEANQGPIGAFPGVGR